MYWSGMLSTPGIFMSLRMMLPSRRRVVGGALLGVPFCGVPLPLPPAPELPLAAALVLAPASLRGRPGPRFLSISDAASWVGWVILSSSSSSTPFSSTVGALPLAARRAFWLGVSSSASSASVGGGPRLRLGRPPFLAGGASGGGDVGALRLVPEAVEERVGAASGAVAAFLGRPGPRLATPSGALLVFAGAAVLDLLRVAAGEKMLVEGPPGPRPPAVWA
mmetsp:Transcript_48817/g.156368  ORF Transcript_48817/g.156368 Transcript_48817/m.156368 type:complete len:221 (+) Transcript_48817:776-1438(+)